MELVKDQAKVNLAMGSQIHNQHGLSYFNN